MDDLSCRLRQRSPARCGRRSIRVGIVAVPAQGAQETYDLLVAGGVRAILNYAPVILRVREGVWVRDVDPVAAIQSMTYYIQPK